MISVEDLVFEYPAKRALDAVSFTIGEGAITALVGPNGAGKSTLLRCMAALYRPFSGRVAVNGFDTQLEPRQVHRSLGYLSDFFGLYDELSVRRAFSYACRTHGVGLDRVEETARQLGLTGYLDTQALALSRDLRQRLAIGLAIIHEPRVLLLDEPASGLDPEARIALSELFLHLRERGMTLVVSSHILAELEDYATEVLILDRGRVVDHHPISSAKQGRTIEVRLSCADDRLGSLLGAAGGVSLFDHSPLAARFAFEGDEAGQGELLGRLVREGLPVCAFGPARSDLQEVYVDKMRKGRGQGGAA